MDAKFLHGMRANITLIRALHFPRACLPLAYVLVEFQQLLLSMVVLFAIRLGSGWPASAGRSSSSSGVLYFWQAETRYGRG
jgi:ABC-type polysaccharide/polyol phosphate export permease